MDPINSEMQDMDFLGRTTAGIPVEMQRQLYEFMDKAIVPELSNLKDNDIITRSNLSQGKAEAATKCLLKAILPFGEGYALKRMRDAERYNIDLPPVQLSFLIRQIIDRDLPITLSVGEEKSYNRAIDFVQNFIGGMYAIRKTGEVGIGKGDGRL